MSESLEHICIPPTALLRQAVQAIDRNTKGIVLVVDESRHLLGTITDGDVRRRLLAGANLDLPVSELFTFPSERPPVVARVGTPREELIRQMLQAEVRQIPLLDDADRVSGLAYLPELLPEPIGMQALVMAGGLGVRLRPLTENLPKPMLPVGGRPLLELTLEKFKKQGITNVSVATHYKAHSIKEHFGCGTHFGVRLDYLNEEQPLGTAGALALMETPEVPLLVVNGDILTEIDYLHMLEFHREHQADLTIGVRSVEIQVPYGVVESSGVNVARLTEKPSLEFLVNAGIYLLEPRVQKMVPSGQRYDFTDLIQQVLDKGHRVVSFPIREYWLDIGKHENYLEAQSYASRTNGHELAK